MKKLSYLLSILFLFAIFYGGSCEDDSTQPVTSVSTTVATTTIQATSGIISGYINLPAGSAHTPNGTRVAIYKDLVDWSNDIVLKFTAAAGDGSYALTNIPPGTYYLDAWKDVNFDNALTIGDLYQVYGSGAFPNFTLSPVPVSAGETVTINLTLIQTK